MSIRTPYLSTLVLLCSAFPAQLFRLGIVLTAAESRRSTARIRRRLAHLWLPGLFLLVAALVWYVAPASGVLRLPNGWHWYAVAAAAALLAPAVEIGVGAVWAVLRRQRVTRVALHERWSGTTAVAVLGAVGVAAAEEIIFRGVGLHLLVSALAWPLLPAVGLTALVYGFNHLYFGWLTVVQKTVTGLGFGVLFLVAGHSVLAPMIAHIGQNLVVLLLLPRLGARP